MGIKLVSSEILEEWLPSGIIRAYKSVRSSSNGSRFRPSYVWKVGTHTVEVAKLDSKGEPSDGFYAFLDRADAFHRLFKAVVVYVERQDVVYGGYGHWGERFIVSCKLRIASLRGLRE